jgi:hypothetical protein
MISITLNETELQALGALLETAVKAGGINAAKAAVPLYEKLEKAVAEFNAASAPKENADA